MRLKTIPSLPALPPTRRPTLITITFSHHQLRLHSSSSSSSPSQPSSGGPTLPERSVSYIPSPSASPTTSTTATRAPQPPARALDQATSLFLRPRPRFLYSAPRFLNLPVNTRIPEVCILGRSNVGKSTLLNALSGLETRGRAGRSHGSKRSRAGLAVTSATAGCTKTLNGYGFGPPLPLLPSGANNDKDGDGDGEGSSSSSSSAGGRSTRSQRRTAAHQREPAPQHSLVVMDMPGYGLHSREEWGAEIAKYLSRRAMLRGAVVLVDSVAGVKDGDRLALELLRDAGVRTAVVLTKADKLVSSSPPSSSSSSSSPPSSSVATAAGSGAEKQQQQQQQQRQSPEALLRKRCVQVWDELRRAERRGRRKAAPAQVAGWKEGRGGWEPEVFVTGAGDPRAGGLGVAGARLAICRLAGLVEGQGAEAQVSSAKAAPLLGTGRVVPFDQIQWAAPPSRGEEEETAAAAGEESGDEVRADLGVPREEGIPETTADPVQQEPARRGRVRPWKRPADMFDAIAQPQSQSRRQGDHRDASF
ncbi:uncharacterized protein E0L32_011493 [Thyridium curvatum]|uniref:EngB-type G domain-containing protein n=1 Tax=Thyridium curvatum TaxID=1093900 RepID=A0A507BJ40_9PEZI|nr:uncharacterized protein E0L32_011493 [Thyridium curvatum]TPX18814.1 hypothetical protein E0L32_011493 [Thyridium curvatum]